MVGKLIGKYQVISELAQGRLGPIYRAQLAHQPSDPQREILLKTVNFNLFTKSLQVQLKARFRREIFAQRQLQHRNIVAVYEFFNVGHDYYLACEHFAGATLRDLLMRQGVPNAVEAASYGRQMLAALDYAHRVSYLDESDFQRTGLVHGDIRLSNLILDARGRVKLTDFSVIHQVIGGELRKLYPELVAYQSPEMQRGSAPDFRSDVFAAGAAFYEMLTGRLPNTAIASEDWRYAKPQSADVEADALLAIRPDVPPALAAAIARAVRRNPADRFAAIGEFLKAVQAIETQLGGTESLSTGANLAAGARGKGMPELPASSERLTAADFLSASLAVSAAASAAMAQKPPASMLRTHQPAIAFSTALPANTNLDIAPPELGRRRERWLLPAFIACALGGTLAGAYFFSSPRSNEGLASNVPAAAVTAQSTAPVESLAPVSSAAVPAIETRLAPLPVAPLESPKLALARQSEQQERYGEALKAYEEYAAANPNTAAANNVTGRIAALRQFQARINTAKESYAAARFDEARVQFTEALRMRPTSRLAQAGVKESDSRIATPLTVPAMAPPKTEEKRAAEETKEPLKDPAANNAEPEPPQENRPKLKPVVLRAVSGAGKTLWRPRVNKPLNKPPNKPMNGGGNAAGKSFALKPKPAGAPVVRAAGAKAGKSGAPKTSFNGVSKSKPSAPRS